MMQLGSLDREKRKRLDVWTLRWWERDPATGTWKHRRKVIGTIEQYPTRTSASLAVRPIRTEILCNGWVKKATQMTIATLTDDYVRRELSEENDQLSDSTKYGYKCRLRKWILDRWGEYRLPDIKPVEFQHWLRTLPLRNQTRRSLRNTMSTLFSHACRYGFYSENPIRFVRQGGQRRRHPFRFDVDDVKKILAELDGMPKVCVQLDYGLGLRQGELFGLKWGDVEWERKWISVVRSIVNGRVGPC
jgi:integrase